MIARILPLSVPLALAAATYLITQELDARRPLGEGEHVYRWVPDWIQLPDGMRIGNTHGCIVTDASGLVYFNTDTEHAVMVFDAGGKYLKSWGKELRGGLHGMSIVEEQDTQYLYLTHTGQHKVFKATLEGEILWELGWPEQSGVYTKEDEYKPTSVAVAPDGHIYVADGYGKSWVHVYDSEREYVRSFGGPGSEDGQLRTPHGLWLSDDGDDGPRLMVADRENNRLQIFDLDGEHLETISGDLRRPCHMHQRAGDTVVADLAGRVTILDSENALVCHLGDNPDPAKRAKNGVPSNQWKDGEFISPHCARWDADGNLYVTDWVSEGRISKLERVR